MNGGFIKLWRVSIESQVWQDEHLWKVWCWCLLRASFKERWVSMKVGRGEAQVRIGPGQFVFGRKQAAKQLKMKPSSVRNRMAKLQNMRNLDIQPDRHFSVVTICNWKAYQNGDCPAGQQRGQPEDRQRTGIGQAKDTYKKGKNVSSSLLPSRTPVVSSSMQPVVDCWNAAAENHPKLSKVRKLTRARSMHLKARMEEPSFRDGWAGIIERAASSDFFCDNGRAWATFDWLIKNDMNYVKVLEGKYDKREKRRADDDEEESPGERVMRMARERNERKAREDAE